MMETPIENKRKDYFNKVSQMGKREFTLLKMQEYGFWPNNLPTPYERKVNESEEDFQKRTELLKQQKQIAEQIATAYDELKEIDQTLLHLKEELDKSWDYEAIRRKVARMIMEKSIERRAERKKKRMEEQKKRSEDYQKLKAETIVFIGRGYSAHLQKKETNIERLSQFNLPIIKDDKELAKFLELSYKELRFLCYHRDAAIKDQYYRYEIPKRSGGSRKIAAPKPGLKKAQQIILKQILEKIPVEETAHGFLKGHSVVTGANIHGTEKELLINMDLENFFPTITFDRVRGCFESFGYSPYLASLLTMICTDCDRIPIEVKGQTYFVSTSKRVLPQGSPASPMLTNIICKTMDYKLSAFADSMGFSYTRYADDLSFSLKEKKEFKEFSSFFWNVSHIIKEQGFQINEKKTKILRKSNRQSITGIVINGTEMGVSRKWVKNFRALLHCAAQQAEQGTLSNQQLNQISGRIAWLKSVNEKRYHRYILEGQELLQRYRKKEKN